MIEQFLSRNQGSAVKAIGDSSTKEKLTRQINKKYKREKHTFQSVEFNTSDMIIKSLNLDFADNKSDSGASNSNASEDSPSPALSAIVYDSPVEPAVVTASSDDSSKLRSDSILSSIDVLSSASTAVETAPDESTTVIGALIPACEALPVEEKLKALDYAPRRRPSSEQSTPMKEGVPTNDENVFSPPLTRIDLVPYEAGQLSSSGGDALLPSPHSEVKPSVDVTLSPTEEGLVTPKTYRNRRKSFTSVQKNDVVDMFHFEAYNEHIITGMHMTFVVVAAYVQVPLFSLYSDVLFALLHAITDPVNSANAVSTYVAAVVANKYVRRATILLLCLPLYIFMYYVNKRLFSKGKLANASEGNKGISDDTKSSNMSPPGTKTEGPSSAALVAAASTTVATLPVVNVPATATGESRSAPPAAPTIADAALKVEDTRPHGVSNVFEIVGHLLFLSLSIYIAWPLLPVIAHLKRTITGEIFIRRGLLVIGSSITFYFLVGRHASGFVSKLTKNTNKL